MSLPLLPLPNQPLYLLTQDQIELLYDIGVKSSLPAWILIAIAPNFGLSRLAVKLSVFLNCVIYSILLIGSVQSGVDFITLDGVLALFRTSNNQLLTGAWIHYICFDLFVGYYIAKDAAKNKLSKLVVLPFLLVALMVGPLALGSWAIFRRFCNTTDGWLSI